MHSPGTILVVDDDPNDQLMIENALRSAGSHWSVCLLNDGAAAIAYLKGEGAYADRTRHPYPSLLITDLKMGPVDGLALLEFLKSTPRSAIVPSVVFSASSDPDDIDKAYALGASCYHVKPSSAANFASLMRLLHDYWLTCEVPEVDDTGVRRITNSAGRIGQRYSADPFIPRPAGTPPPGLT
jgi:CheY-like chemotaxis protein